MSGFGHHVTHQDLLQNVLPNGNTRIKGSFASSEQKDEQANSKPGLATPEASSAEEQDPRNAGTFEPRLPGSTGESTGNAGLSALQGTKSSEDKPYKERNLLAKG